MSKEFSMYKNKAENGLNNISGSNIKKIRQALPGKVSQRKLADMLQMEGLDLDKSAKIQNIFPENNTLRDIGSCSSFKERIGTLRK